MLFTEVGHPGHNSRDRGGKVCVCEKHAGVQVCLDCIPLTSKADSGALM